jgi:hypothetical protein
MVDIVPERAAKIRMSSATSQSATAQPQPLCYSRYNDRPAFPACLCPVGSIGESSTKEALADNLPWRISTPTERLPHASGVGALMRLEIPSV